MILGYTLATFPKVATYIFIHNQRRNKDFWHNCKRNKKRQPYTHMQGKKGPCIIGGEYPDIRCSTQQGEKLNKDKEGGNLQPSKQQEKGQH